MGNALACSVALKSIELFEMQDYMAKIRRIEAITRREMEGFSDSRVKEVRIMGGCVCLEVKDAATLNGYQQSPMRAECSAGHFSPVYTPWFPISLTEEELVRVLDTMKAWFAR